MHSIEERLRSVRGSIALAEKAAGREPGAVELIAVSKTQPVERIRDAILAGQLRFGENRVQEAVEKFALLESRAQVELHLIGHLQSNKAKLVPGTFTWVDSIDAQKTAKAISQRVGHEAPPVSLLLQFDCSGEESKSGYRNEDELCGDAEEISALPGVQIRGVMTIGPNSNDEGEVERAFERTYRVYETLQRRLGEESIDVLSMGMSADYELAIRCGSTQVRLGSAIFGARG